MEKQRIIILWDIGCINMNETEQLQRLSEQIQKKNQNVESSELKRIRALEAQVKELSKSILVLQKKVLS